MRIKLKGGMLLSGFIPLFLVIVFISVFGTPTYSAGSMGYSVSPKNKEIDLEKDSTSTFYMTVTNTEDSPLKISCYPMPYVVTDSDYTTTFEEEASYSQMTDWVKPVKKNVTVPAKSELKVYFTITVPEKFSGDVQYCYIMFHKSAKADTSGGGSANIGVGTRVGALLIARTKGAGTFKGEIKDYGLPGFINMSTDISPYVDFKNTGTIDYTADVKVTVKNALSGKKVKFKKGSNEISNGIIPGTERRETLNVDVQKPGIYKVTLTAEAKALGLTDTYSKTIIVCEVIHIVLFFVVLAILVLLIVLIVLAIKRSHKTKKAILKELEELRKEKKE